MISVDATIIRRPAHYETSKSISVSRFDQQDLESRIYPHLPIKLES
jgi:hypothetical protein